MTQYWNLLKTRPAFRYLWFAQVVSLTGDWFNTIAAVILVNRYTNSGLAVGGLFLARALPPFLLGPFSGVLADRFNRKYILIASDLLRAVIVLGFLWVDRPERAWLLFVLSVLQFSVSAFFEPARAAIMPNLLASNELITGNTLSSTTWSAMLAFGAAIGGLTAAALGTQIALVIDSLSFVGSALFVFLGVTYIPRVRDHTEPHTTGLGDYLAGLGYVREHPQVGLLVLVKAMGQIGSVDILNAVYAAHVFPYGKDGALTLGLMFAFFGLGAIIGPLVGNAVGVGSIRRLQIAINVGYLCLPLAWTILGVAPTLPIALLGLTLRGIGGSINWTYSDVLIQISTIDKFMGRVYSLDFGIYTLALSISVWVTGTLIDSTAHDPRVIAIYFGLGSLIPLAIWTVTTFFLKMDQAMAMRGTD